eukprot:m.264178 g.264178  ORF g.264178 m.264178 type:complete len:257 (-) comp54468_c0_seq1:70-840(-)
MAEALQQQNTVSSKRARTEPTSETHWINSATKWVKSELASNDASHDWQHIARVTALAQRLYHDESPEASESEKAIVTLSALLHDVADWKYSGSLTEGERKTTEFLKSLDSPSCPEEIIERIEFIIKRVSFHDELTRSTEERAAMVKDIQLAVVQDADRLDAIGAIGIARCLTYGGVKKRQLYTDATSRDLTTAAIASSKEYLTPTKNGATIDHFFEKLLHIKDMMKTSSGEKVALLRHQYMVDFLHQIFGEIEGKH